MLWRSRSGYPYCSGKDYFKPAVEKCLRQSVLYSRKSNDGAVGTRIWKVVQAFYSKIEADAVVPWKRFVNELQGRDPDSAPERWRTCVRHVDDGLGWILSRFFVEKAFSAKAKEMRNRRDVYLTGLNRGLDERMASNSHKPCIQANVINDAEAKLNKEELTSISLTMLSGGLDTITTQVAWFCALLVNRPDIQDKAAEEIRKFYGDDKPLCDSEDDQQCAYIVALVRESLRYYTVLRLALPKCSIRDVVYNGVTIPKGTVVFLNSWACNMGEYHLNCPY